MAEGQGQCQAAGRRAEPQFKARSPGLSARTLSSSLCPPATGWLPSPPGASLAHQGLVIWVETAPDLGTAAETLPEVITGRSSDLQKSQTRLPLAIDCHARAVP